MVDMIGVIATVLGTILAVVFGILPLLQSKKRLRVTMDLQRRDMSLVLFSGYDDTRPYVITSVINLGSRPVALESWHILLPDGTDLRIPNGKWGGRGPLELPPDSSERCERYIEPYDLAQAIREHQLAGVVKVRGQFRDHSGKAFTSKPLAFDTDYWMEQHAS